MFSGSEIKGEYTLVLRGATDEEVREFKYNKNKDIPVEQQLEGIKKLKNLTRKEALKQLAELRGQSKRQLYDELNT